MLYRTELLSRDRKKCYRRCGSKVLGVGSEGRFERSRARADSRATSSFYLLGEICILFRYTCGFVARRKCKTHAYVYHNIIYVIFFFLLYRRLEFANLRREKKTLLAVLLHFLIETCLHHSRESSKYAWSTCGLLLLLLLWAISY